MHYTSTCVNDVILTENFTKIRNNTFWVCFSPLRETVQQSVLRERVIRRFWSTVPISLHVIYFQGMLSQHVTLPKLEVLLNFHNCLHRSRCCCEGWSWTGVSLCTAHRLHLPPWKGWWRALRRYSLAARSRDSLLPSVLPSFHQFTHFILLSKWRD